MRHPFCLQTLGNSWSRIRLYALLIGVDKYESPTIQNLAGAMGDAEKMQAFLLAQDPPLRDERIKLLKDEEATAASIVEALTSLGDEKDICFGDPILIYYAGHGSNLKKPDGWPSADQYIQCLTPHDARIVGDNIEGVVTDIAFGALLQRLADKKGNSIVCFVIYLDLRRRANYDSLRPSSSTAVTLARPPASPTRVFPEASCSRQQTGRQT